MNNEITSTVSDALIASENTTAEFAQEPLQKPATDSVLGTDQPMHAVALSDLPPLITGTASPELSRLLQVYLVFVVLANFALLFLKGYSQDLGYWQDWVGQLSRTGYDGFNPKLTFGPMYLMNHTC